MPMEPEETGDIAMARRTLRMELLEGRAVPSVTPDEPKTEETPTETPDEVVQTLDGETTDETVETTSIDNGPDETNDDEVNDTSVSYPPVEFGEGNFEDLSVGSKYILVSGLRSGEAGLYSFDASGNLIDTGKTYTPFPGPANRTTSVRGATGDVNGDGVVDIAFVTTGGTTTVLRIIDSATGKDITPTRTVFGDNFRGGANVTMADTNGDGKDEVIVTPDAGGSGRVRVFKVATNGSLSSPIDFFGIDDVNFRGGASATVADLTGDGKVELVVAAGVGGGSRLAVYGLETGVPVKLVADFFALTGESAGLRSGISLSSGDLNADGYADLVVGTPSGGSPQVYVLDGKAVLTDSATAVNNPLSTFHAFDSRGRTGVRVTMKDADGDGKADIIAGTGEGNTTMINGYRGDSVIANPFAATADTFVDPFRAVKNAGRFAAGVAVG